MAKGCGMDKQHMSADERTEADQTSQKGPEMPDRRCGPPVLQLLEAFRRRPQSQRLRIIYMQIHTVQVRTHKPGYTHKQNKEEVYIGGSNEIYPTNSATYSAKRGSGRKGKTSGLKMPTRDISTSRMGGQS